MNWQVGSNALYFFLSFLPSFLSICQIQARTTYILHQSISQKPSFKVNLPTIKTYHPLEKKDTPSTLCSPIPFPPSIHQFIHPIYLFLHMRRMRHMRRLQLSHLHRQLSPLHLIHPTIIRRADLLPLVQFARPSSSLVLHQVLGLTRA